MTPQRRLAPAARVHARVEVCPPWPWRLPGSDADGVLRRRGGVVERLLRVGEEAFVVRVAQPERDRVVLGAWGESRPGAEEALLHMRFALGLDDDLRPFYERFWWHPVIGPALRARPWLRVARRPDPFEALTWAISEQLIESSRAAAIERRMVARLGSRCPHTGLRAPPGAATLAGTAPALLQSLDLSGGRARALVRAAREITLGRIDLRAPDQERGWRRLRAIPGIGAWTVEMLALHGQGRYDQVPAGDLGLLKLVGRLRAGRPHVRAEEAEVREFFAPFAPYGGLAASYALRLPGALRAAAPAHTP